MSFLSIHKLKSRTCQLSLANLVLTTFLGFLTFISEWLVQHIMVRNITGRTSWTRIFWGPHHQVFSFTGSLVEPHVAFLTSFSLQYGRFWWIDVNAGFSGIHEVFGFRWLSSLFFGKAVVSQISLRAYSVPASVGIRNRVTNHAKSLSLSLHSNRMRDNTR